MKFTTIKLEGEILSSEIIEKINQGDVEGQSPVDFGFDKKTAVKDEIISTWAEASSLWKAYKHRMDRVSEEDMGTTVTRNIFIVPFLSLLGFELQLSGAETLNGKSYAISHRDTRLDSLPVIVMGFKDSLDQKRNDGGPRMSPHGLMQEYLNLTEHLYGIITNGLQMRVLRDSSRLIRQSYIEFDLERMFEEEQYSDFAVMYRLIHSTRFPVKKESADSCVFEKYHQDALDSGARIREGLSNAMEKSINLLGNGFLNHLENIELRELATSRDDTAIQYYQNLLRVLYRLLFLMVIEERNLIFSSEAKESNRKIYYNYYSVNRLRKLSERSHSFQEKYCDIWLSLLNTFELFNEEKKGEVIEIEPLGGLFNDNTIGILRRCSIDNKTMLECFGLLNFFRNSDTGLRVKVNYASLNVEEFGSVYEGMLDFHPDIKSSGGRFIFRLVAGTERKTTASYYTPEELVSEIIKSALFSVVDERIGEIVTRKQNIQKLAINDRKSIEVKLLDIKICDPACGSGHFLLGSARYMGKLLARIRTGEDEPSPSEVNMAKRDVISHCIYGVDRNPMAVELCKVALWLEGHSAGSPLSFIEHHVRCGDSLVGVMSIKEIKKNGIPDNALNPVIGDIKEISSNLKKVNAKHVGYDHNASLFAEGPIDLTGLEDEFKKLDSLKDDSIDLLKAKEDHYKQIKSEGGLWSKTETLCNLWTSAFFIHHTVINKDNKRLITNDEFFRYLNGEQIANSYIASASALASELRFFHWELEFPEVFSVGGFDCVVGNPPWEKYQAEEAEFFKGKNDFIVNEKDSSARKKYIDELVNTDIKLFNSWIDFKTMTLKTSNFFINSMRFKYSANGNLNLYKLFVEHSRIILNQHGRCGLIVQSGLITDELSKEVFEDFMINKNFVSVYDFVNTNKLFNIHGQMRFSLITISKRPISNKTIFKFLMKSPNEIERNDNGIYMDYSDIKLINPNVLICPQISFQYSFDLIKKIYNKRLLIKALDITRSFGIGFWGEMFNMTRAKKYLYNEIDIDSDLYLPLYESKYFHQYDHRFATFENQTIEDSIKGNTKYIEEFEKDAIKNPIFRYFVLKNEAEIKCKKYGLDKKWLLCVRSVTSATNERTIIASILPRTGIGNSANIALINDPIKACHLLATLNSIITDFIAQVKVGNQNFNIYIIEQLPILMFDDGIKDKIVSKVLELTYTSWGIKSFADDIWKEASEKMRSDMVAQWNSNNMEVGGYEWNPPEGIEVQSEGCPLPPFKWKEERRATIKAELDAIYARLYDLTKEELRYILDPKEALGISFPGETFRVLKDKELKKYGEYRTQRLVLEAWDRLWG